MTKRILSAKTLTRKTATTRTVGLVRGKTPRKDPKKAAAEPVEPLEPTPRSMVHDAINELQAARRAFDDMTVHRFRGKHDLVQYDYIVFLESVQRVHRHLVQLDLDLPEGGAS